MEANYLTMLCWFCHTSTYIHHRYTRVPHPEPPSVLPHHTIPLGRPSAPAPSVQYHALNLDWRFISYMILYMFQCTQVLCTRMNSLDHFFKYLKNFLQEKPSEQSFGLCGRGRGWDDLGEWHWNMYNIIYEMSRQSRFNAWYWMLRAGALRWPRGMVLGGRREGGSGRGTRVYLWWIHVDVWQNQYNIVK